MNFARFVDITAIDRLELQVASDTSVNQQPYQLTWSITPSYITDSPRILHMVTSLVHMVN